MCGVRACNAGVEQGRDGCGVLGWELGLSVQGWPWGSQRVAVSTAVVGQGGGEVREGERDSVRPPSPQWGSHAGECVECTECVCGSRSCTAISTWTCVCRV